MALNPIRILLSRAFWWDWVGWCRAWWRWRWLNPWLWCCWTSLGLSLSLFCLSALGWILLSSIRRVCHPHYYTQAAPYSNQRLYPAPAACPACRPSRSWSGWVWGSAFGSFGSSRALVLGSWCLRWHRGVAGLKSHSEISGVLKSSCLVI